jgi:hypothetical protein
MSVNIAGTTEHDARRQRGAVIPQGSQGVRHADLLPGSAQPAGHQPRQLGADELRDRGCRANRGTMNLVEILRPVLEHLDRNRCAERNHGRHEQRAGCALRHQRRSARELRGGGHGDGRRIGHAEPRLHHADQLAPGRYFLGVQMNGTTDTLRHLLRRTAPTSAPARSRARSARCRRRSRRPRRSPPRSGRSRSCTRNPHAKGEIHAERLCLKLLENIERLCRTARTCVR